ncbi:methionyl-tRNA formyltransferase, mitochondrial-like [Lasioglossum baleicum]|uniref:methionyl-tRNA formyltransferase, mitochondrial-like n=1 Tax=Lasioglossum baleicum TaxID=434251 RepID=UPI003FCDBD70
MLISNVRIFRSKQFVCSFKELRKVLTLNVKRKLHSKEPPDQLSQSGPWNVLFFGTNGFAVESLKALYKKYDSKIVQRLEVVTLNTVKENAVIKFAQEKELAINYWPLENAIHHFHIGIVVSFGHLIPSKIIKSFPLGMLNVHGSLLPRWRGAAPIIYSLMNDDDQTGVTIMRIKPKKFDIGEIIVQKEVNIGEHETLPELHDKLAKLGANLLEKTFEDLPGALRSAKPQNEANATYAPKITSKIATVKWDEMFATNIYNLHRALVGLYPLSTRLGNKTVKLYDIMITDKSTAERLIEQPPGMVTYDKVSNKLIVKCKGAGCISVKSIGVQGKSVMTARDFNNGFIIGKNETNILFS